MEIKSLENRNFIRFIRINRFLNQYQKLETVRIKDINEVTIFNRFIEEFLDFDELLSVLEKNALVKKNISYLPKKDQKDKLYTYAKSFVVEKKKDPAILKFTWHNVDEGKKILTDTLNLVLINLEKKTFKDLNDIIKIVKKNSDFQARKKIDSLLKIITETRDNADESKEQKIILSNEFKIFDDKSFKAIDLL